jgi:molybdopterin-guanine dinucleotide biosynthesis protein A
MGRDKALIEVDGTAMVDRLGAVLAAVCTDVVAIGPSPLAGGLRAVPDEFPGEGPLGGVITALRFADDDYDAVVIVACDLPWLDVDTLGQVVAAFANAANDTEDVAVARTDRLEPLCAVWDPRVAKALDLQFDRGERAVHRALDGLRVRAVDVAAAPLRNVNVPNDLAIE